MRNSKKTILSGNVALVLCLLITIPQNALSWGWAVHMNTANEAYYLVLQDFFTLVSPELYVQSNMQKGVLEPDRNKGNLNHTKLYDCAWATNHYAKKCEKMIRNKEDWSEIIFTMGKATHFIQDMNCPHHGIGKYIKGDHEKFEETATHGFWKDGKFDGFQYVVNYKNFAHNAARFSKRYIKFEDRINEYEYYKKIMEPLWDHTTNDVIDLWLTILYNGLGEDKYKEYGLPKKEGTRAEKKIKYPAIDSLKTTIEENA